MDPVVLTKFFSLFELVTNTAMEIRPLVHKMEADKTFAAKLNDAIDGLGELITGAHDAYEAATGQPAIPASGASGTQAATAKQGGTEETGQQ